jgi:hypothetical protein
VAKTHFLPFITKKKVERNALGRRWAIRTLEPAYGDLPITNCEPFKGTKMGFWWIGGLEFYIWITNTTTMAFKYAHSIGRGVKCCTPTGSTKATIRIKLDEAPYGHMHHYCCADCISLGNWHGIPYHGGYVWQKHCNNTGAAFNHVYIPIRYGSGLCTKRGRPRQYTCATCSPERWNARHQPIRYYRCVNRVLPHRSRRRSINHSASMDKRPSRKKRERMGSMVHTSCRQGHQQCLSGHFFLFGN